MIEVFMLSSPKIKQYRLENQKRTENRNRRIFIFLNVLYTLFFGVHVYWYHKSKFIHPIYFMINDTGSYSFFTCRMKPGRKIWKGCLLFFYHSKSKIMILSPSFLDLSLSKYFLICSFINSFIFHPVIYILFI